MSFKYGVNGQFFVYHIDEEALEAMWEHAKYSGSLELYVEVDALKNQNMNTLETHQAFHVIFV